MVFQTLYKAICSGSVDDFGLLDDVLECARLNKVLLHFLRVAGVWGDVRKIEEERLKNIVETVGVIVENFDGLDYVFYKLVKPVIYVPADIDILVSCRDVWEAVSRLKCLGFRIEVLEPYTVTMVRSSIIVDLYLHPAIGGVIYLDGGRLLKYKCFKKYYSIEIPVLEDCVEAIVVAAHSIYKERIYTLNDYMTVKKYLCDESFRIAEKFKSTSCLNLSLYINRLVESNRLTLPYHIPLSIWAKILLSKFLDDNIARSTILNMVYALRDRRIGKQIISKLTRKTY